MKKLVLLLLLICCLICPAYSIIKTNNLVGAYRFEGNANDWSGNGNNGTVSGATLTTGKFGQAYSFDGVNDTITIGSLLLTTGATTIVMWMKPSVSQQKGLGDFRVGGSGLILYERLIDSGTERAMMGFRGNPEMSTPANLIIVGSWNFLVFVYNGGDKSSIASFKIYVNGISQTLVPSGCIGGSTTYNRIGSDQSSAFFNGLIDEVRIYNRTLTESEIRSLMLGYEPGEF